MTFAEIIIFILLVTVFSFVLSPLQKKLERKLYTFFKSRNSRPHDGSIIDVTNSIEKDKKNE